jgi:hypothetical protein
VTEGERHGLTAALALLEHGFADYAETILEKLAGRPGVAPRLKLTRDGPPAAIVAIRETLVDPP